MNNINTDNIIKQLNANAIKLMSQYNIEMIDLHTPIINKCGPVPQKQCFNQTDCWSPHCPGQGYQWLSTYIVPVLKKAILEL